MTEDEFFSEVSAKLEKHDDAHSAKKRLQQANMDFIASVIPQMVATANSYAARLKDKGITALIKSSEIMISVEVRYGSDYRTLLACSSDNSRLELTTYFIGEKGSQVSSRTGLTYDRDNWNHKIFEEALQNCIKRLLESTKR